LVQPQRSHRNDWDFLDPDDGKSAQRLRLFLRGPRPSSPKLVWQSRWILRIDAVKPASHPIAKSGIAKYGECPAA